MPRDFILRPDERVHPEHINRLSESTEIGLGPGLMAGVTRHGMVVGVEPNLGNWGYVSNSWLGRIIRRGPDSQPDFDDSRYWVREVRWGGDGDPYTARPTFTSENDNTFRRWVAAVNIAEYRGSSPAIENHSLVEDYPSNPDDGPLVWVHGMVTKRLRLLHWFSGALGGAVEGYPFVVIRNFISEDSWYVEVERIVPNDSDPYDGGLEFDGEIIPAVCRPGTRGRHFQHLVYSGSNANDPLVQCCELVSARGLNWVSPALKLGLVRVPPGTPYRVSNCLPLQTIP